MEIVGGRRLRIAHRLPRRVHCSTSRSGYDSAGTSSSVSGCVLRFAPTQGFINGIDEATRIDGPRRPGLGSAAPSTQPVDTAQRAEWKAHQSWSLRMNQHQRESLRRSLQWCESRPPGLISSGRAPRHCSTWVSARGLQPDIFPQARKHKRWNLSLGGLRYRSAIIIRGDDEAGCRTINLTTSFTAGAKA